MKIETKDKITTFKDVEEGNVFFCNNDYFMKTQEIYLQNGDRVNAIVLRDGLACFFFSNDDVCIVDARVVIG